MSLKIPIKNIFKLLIVFSIFMFILTAYQNSISSIKVYAGPSADADEGSGDKTAKKRTGGINTLQQGFLLYVADKESGDTMTPGHTYNAKTGDYCSSIGISRQQNPLKHSGYIDYTLYVTKRDAAYPEHWYCRDNVPLGVKYNNSTESWEPNGKEVMDWLMRQDTSSGEYWYEWLIQHYYGDAFLNEVRSHADDWLICVEFFHWNNVWINGSNTGKKLLATNDGWVTFYNGYKSTAPSIDDKYRKTGDPQINGYTHGVALFSMLLEYSYWGFDAHGGDTVRKLTYDDVRPYGGSTEDGCQTDYGLQVIVQDSSSIHTYWSPNGSPGDPEPPSTPPQEGTCSIVKGYYTENTTTNTKTNDGVYYEDKVCNNIIIDDEPEYKIVSWSVSTTYKTTMDPTNWSVPGTVSQTGTTSATVKLLSPEKTVYVLLKKEETTTPPVEASDYDYKLTQSQITRQSKLSSPNNFVHVPSTLKSFEFKRSAFKCGGHSAPTESDPDHKAHCTWGTWTNNDFAFGIKNTKWADYKTTVLVTRSDVAGREVKRGETTKRLAKGTESATRFTSDYWWWPTYNSSASNQWDYLFLLARGEDKLTVAKWVNAGEAVPVNGTDGTFSDANRFLKDLSGGSTFFTVANKKSSADYSRYKDNENAKFSDLSQGKKGYYTRKFNMKFDQDNDSASGVDYEVKAKPSSGSGHGTCSEQTRTWALTSSPNSSNANKGPLEINDITVKIEVYTGKKTLTPNKDCDTSPMITTGSGSIQTGLSSGIMIPSGSTGGNRATGTKITFTPYVRMKYDTLTTTNLTAYVLGEYEREIYPNDYIELDWGSSNGTRTKNLTLTSSQWSTHAQALADHTSTDNTGNVLPGGATLKLSIAKDDRRTITARTYQTIIMDSGYGKTQIGNTGGSYGTLSESNAKTKHTEYVDSVVNGIQNVMVNQWIVGKDDATWDEIFKDNQLVTNGSDIKFLKNYDSSLRSGNKASDEEKYYLKNTRGNSDSAKLDASAGSTTTTYYTFRTDTSGNVYMRISSSSGNSGSEVKILSQNQTYTSIHNAKAKEIDNKTYVVRKLLASVERGGGNDSTATWSKKWYNEAMDGITVMVQETKITIGYVSPSERWTVLDPKLIPNSETNTKTDGTTTQSTKGSLFTAYFSSAYKTDDYSQAYGSSNTNVLGEFSGYKVKLVNLQNMFTSKVFYIPNVTTQDLN